MPRKRFDEYSAHVKARISDVVRSTAEACENLAIVDMSHLSEMDANWVGRMMGEAQQVGATMEVELLVVGTPKVLSEIPRVGIRTFPTMDDALKAAAPG